jgi:phospholipid-translocating ATPase
VDGLAHLLSVFIPSALNCQDWKLRLAVPACQKLPSDEAVSRATATIYAAPPSRDIYAFEGDLTMHEEAEGGAAQEPLALENTLWSNTVLASGDSPRR